MSDLFYPPQMTFWQAFRAGLVRYADMPGYIAYLHTLPCVITKARGGSQVTVHHVIGHGIRGHGGKTPDALAFPLRYDLHLPDYPRSIHAMNYGWRRWEEEHGSQLDFSLQTLMYAIAAGKLVFKP